MKKQGLVLIVLILLAITGFNAQVGAGEMKPVTGTVDSADGVTIHYQVHGKGDPALVFVHGWCCDHTYWNNQVPYFSKKYKVVTIDLAGHGDSGLNREKWTMQAYAHDVAAVVKKLDLKKVVLLGHSMGGPVVAETTLLIPDRMIGLVGVDTFNTLEAKYTPEQKEMFIGPLKADFAKGSENFVRMFMFQPDTDPALIDKIAKDMSSAPSKVGLGSMEELVNHDIVAAFDKIKVPVYCVNADKFPFDVEAAKRHTVAFKIRILPKSGHFLHMEKPKEFNKLLDETLDELIKTK
jgi:pimeloyl-ACP methyl ester carboxylesterase